MNVQLQQTLFDLWRIISQGGWVMGAIFLAGQLGWFLILERWWHFRKMDGKIHRVPGALEAGRGAKGLFGQVARAIGEARPQGQEAMVMKAREVLHRHVPDLSRHLGTLAILAGVAPLLGLAGTVMGIMETFRVITLYGAGNPSMMAGGIAQALVVTEAGLVVAFPILLCHDHLQKRADAIEDECVAGATRLIRLYAGKGTPA
ncbi:MAG TPA: MotA/TolQ/ExbB proton channel family protein [Fibrobacteria bacterium]|nr:MotA/TolQ/ExbB proton channel family protein [Fibrobacteria bacterium]